MRAGLLVLALASLFVAAWLLRETRSAPAAPPIAGAAEEEPRTRSSGAGELVLALPESPGVARFAPEPGRAEPAAEPTTRDAAPRAPETALHPVAARVARTTGEPVLTALFVNPSDGADVDARSDGEGQYELLLPPGTWTLAARSESPRLVADTRALGGPIDVPYSGPPLEFVLHEPARLDGLVVDAAGAPVEGVEVRVSPPAFAGWGTPGVTDDAGRFRFEDLPIGDTVLIARHGELEASRTEVLDEGGNTAAPLALPPGGRLVVFAYDEDGNARDDVRTLVYRDSRQLEDAKPPGEPYGPLASGPVEVLGLFPGSESGLERIVTARAEIVPGEVTEVRLEPEPVRGVVEGIVRLAGKPESGLTLFAFLEGGALTETVRLLQTDELGEYRLELPHPAGVVFAIGSEGRIRVVSHVPASDAERVQHDIDIVAARLSGRIEGVEPGETWGLDLQPEPRAIELPVPQPSRIGGVGGDGTFAFDDLRPGTYRVWARENGGDVAGPATVELREDRATTDVTLVRRAAGRVSGAVRDATGGPVAHAVVHVRPGASDPRPTIARTDAAGRFEVAHLFPGEVFVCAQSEAGVGTRRVAVTPGRTTPVALTLAPGARIRVRALRPDGAPEVASLRAFDADGAEVSAFRGPAGSSDSYSAVVSTSERVFGPLPPGRYEIVAETAAGRVVRRKLLLGTGDLDIDLGG